MLRKKYFFTPFLPKWSNLLGKNNHFRLLLLIIISFGQLGITQSGNIFSLKDCYYLAQERYPLRDQKELLILANRIEKEKLDVSRMPEISWNARASVQSENVELPFDIPSVGALDLPLVRVQTTFDAQYVIYDGGLTEAQKIVEEAKLNAQDYSVTVEIEKVKSTVNHLFFAILLSQEKEKILLNSAEQVKQNQKTLLAGVKHGVVLPSEAQKLEVELLRLQAQIISAQGDITGFLEQLSTLLDTTLTTKTKFKIHDLDPISWLETSERAEFQLFEFQKNQILANEQLITAAQKPKVSAFAQAGLGYPNPLNFFDNTLSPFATAGVSFSWKITDWKQEERDRQLLTIQSQLIDAQKATFEKNLRVLDGDYRSKATTLLSQIEKAKTIAALEATILNQVSAQLREGVITATEYLNQVHAEIAAQLHLKTYALQLKQVYTNYLTHKGML